MKQCPNPNCIYYTRLEELPDAYVRCPACGGQLVDSSTPSGTLRSGHLPKMSALPGRDLDDEFEQAFPDEGLQPASQGIAGAADAGQYEEGEYYPYDESSEYEVQYGGPRPLSRLGRLGYMAGGLILVAACGLFVFVVATRILPQSSAVTGTQATQTTLAAIRPAVNTPISELPTANALPTAAPPTSVPPTGQPPPQVTDTPGPPPPTSTAAPPAPTAQANSTAPPAQTQPTGGVLDAFMAAGIQGGEPVDRTTSYGPSDPFVLAVQAQFGPGGVTSMRTLWYGPDGGLLYELPRDFAQAGTYYSTFTLRKSAPWLEGNYRVDIYTNGSPSPAYSVGFTVSP
ncbi:MAG: IBR domain-containing protein [Chloroflexia bacterium]